MTTRGADQAKEQLAGPPFSGVPRMRWTATKCAKVAKGANRLKKRTRAAKCADDAKRVKKRAKNTKSAKRWRKGGLALLASEPG